MKPLEAFITSKLKGKTDDKKLDILTGLELGELKLFTQKELITAAESIRESLSPSDTAKEKQGSKNNGVRSPDVSDDEGSRGGLWECDEDSEFIGHCRKLKEEYERSNP